MTPRLHRLASLALLGFRLLSFTALGKAGAADVRHSFEKIDYLLLDPVDVYSRDGRKTHYERDAMRRVQSVTDPLNRTIQYQRLACCGNVDMLIDANNHLTSWRYDVRDRVTEKSIGNTVVATYAYDSASGRLASIGDALQQTKRFTYTAAGDLGAINYAGVAPTPGVSFEYNDPLGRMTQMTDGTGASVYSYWPMAVPGQTVAGGGRWQEITRPGSANPAGETIHLDYDVLGRVFQRSIGAGAANVEQVAFDMERVASVTKDLGTLSRVYDSGVGRWLSRDPLEENGGPNLYSYVLNSPMAFTDLLGLEPIAVDPNFMTYMKEGAKCGAKASREKGPNKGPERSLWLYRDSNTGELSWSEMAIGHRGADGGQRTDSPPTPKGKTLVGNAHDHPDGGFITGAQAIDRSPIKTKCRSLYA